MKQVLKLGTHKVDDLAVAIETFFSAKHMNVERYATSDGKYCIRAETKDVDMIDVYGDRMKCQVELHDLGDGTVSVTAGKGSWGGKLLGAGVVVGGSVMLPACWLVYLTLVLTTVWTGKNVIRQASLPEQVCDFASAYLLAI